MKFSSFKNVISKMCLQIGMMIRVFASGPGDLGSIPGRIIQRLKK